MWVLQWNKNSLYLISKSLDIRLSQLLLKSLKDISLFLLRESKQPFDLVAMSAWYETWTRHASFWHLLNSCPTERKKRTLWLIRIFYKLFLLNFCDKRIGNSRCLKSNRSSWLLHECVFLTTRFWKNYSVVYPTEI